VPRTPWRSNLSNTDVAGRPSSSKTSSVDSHQHSPPDPTRRCVPDSLESRLPDPKRHLRTRPRHSPPRRARIDGRLSRADRIRPSARRIRLGSTARSSISALLRKRPPTNIGVLHEKGWRFERLEAANPHPATYRALLVGDPRRVRSCVMGRSAEGAGWGLFSRPSPVPPSIEEDPHPLSGMDDRRVVIALTRVRPGERRSSKPAGGSRELPDAESARACESSPFAR